MRRCVGCQSYVDVRLVNDLPWCFPCVTDGLADEYDHRTNFFLDAAVDAEIIRRHLPGQGAGNDRVPVVREESSGAALPVCDVHLAGVSALPVDLVRRD